MVDCPEFLDAYSDYRDGRLTTDRMDGFEAHLRTCESCARYDRVVGGGVKVFLSLPALNPSPDFQTRLLDRLSYPDGVSGRHGSGASLAVTILICVAIGASAWLPALRHESGPVRLPAIVAHAPYHDLNPVLLRGIPAPMPSRTFQTQPAFYGQGLLLEQSTTPAVLAYRPASAYYFSH